MPGPHTRVALTPATGAIAANVPGIAQARLVEKMAPAEIPVANTWWGSMHSVDSARPSIARTNGTSLPGNGANRHVRSATPEPLGVMTTSPTSAPFALSLEYAAWRCMSDPSPWKLNTSAAGRRGR